MTAAELRHRGDPCISRAATLEAANEGSDMAPQQLLQNNWALDGVPNFRDVGGLSCVGGSCRTKPGTLFRSSSLYMCTCGSSLPEDKYGASNDVRTLIHRFRVKTLVDLRTNEESELQANNQRLRRGIDNFVNYCDFFSTVKAAFKKAGKGKFEKILTIVRRPARDTNAEGDFVNVADKMDDIPKPIDESELQLLCRDSRVIFHVDLAFRSFLAMTSTWLLLLMWLLNALHLSKLCSYLLIKFSVNTYTQKEMFLGMLHHQGPEIAFIFDIAADPQNYPLIIGCALGKDRTGFIIALLLAAADVQFDAIQKNFLATTANLAKSDELCAEIRRMNVASHWLVCREDSLTELFTCIEEEYDGLKNYLNRIGVSDDKIKAIKANITEKCL